MKMLPIQTPGRRPLSALPPLALYVHLPWCLRKCPYCDFNSHEAREEIPQRRYVDALVADLEAALPLVWGRRVHSVFLGGGTPSLFEPERIADLLDAIRARVPLAAEVEITMEANPGTFEAGRFRGFGEAGVNRLSIGVQSFDDARLAALGRVHGGGEARAAVRAALDLFARVNVDLMYALPGQDALAAARDVSIALDLGVRHLSAYQLTLEPNTVFHLRPPVLPDEAQAACIEEAVHGALAAGGLARYEVSAFAVPGEEARHNLNYWTFGDYLGIGAGAHGKLSLPDRLFRQVRHRQPRQYMESALSGDARASEEDIPAQRLPFEFMLNALRLEQGVPPAMFEERTGLGLSAIARALAEALDRGLLDPDPRVLRASELGYRFLNDLVELFLPEEDPPVAGTDVPPAIEQPRARRDASREGGDTVSGSPPGSRASGGRA